MQFHGLVAVAPVRICDEHVAGEIVRPDAAWFLFHERQAAQPVEEVPSIVDGQRCPKQALSRRAGMCTDLQGTSVQLAGNTCDETFQQPLHQIGRGAQCRGQGEIAVVLVEKVEEQCQRERMAMGRRDEVLVQFVGHAFGTQQHAGIARREVAQRDDDQEITPPLIVEPAGRRFLPPGDDDDGAGRHRRHELLTQPSVQGRGMLIGVQQQQAPPCPEITGTDIARRAAQLITQRSTEGRGRRLDRRQVQPRHSRCRIDRRILHRAQQGALAHTAWPVDERDGQRRAGPGQRSQHEVDLGVTTDEAPRSRPLQPTGDSFRSQLEHRSVIFVHARWIIHRRPMPDMSM